MRASISIALPIADREPFEMFADEIIIKESGRPHFAQDMPGNRHAGRQQGSGNPGQPPHFFPLATHESPNYDREKYQNRAGQSFRQQAEAQPQKEKVTPDLTPHRGRIIDRKRERHHREGDTNQQRAIDRDIPAVKTKEKVGRKHDRRLQAEHRIAQFTSERKQEKGG